MGVEGGLTVGGMGVEPGPEPGAQLGPVGVNPGIWLILIPVLVGDGKRGICGIWGVGIRGFHCPVVGPCGT